MTKKVAIMFHTIEPKPLAHVAEHVEYQVCDVPAFNLMTKKEFMELVNKAANSFWSKMAREHIKKNLLAANKIHSRQA